MKKIRKKEKQIVEKILTKVMESGMLLNGTGHFAVYDEKGKINCIEIYNGLFLPEIDEVGLYVNTGDVYWDEEDNEHSIDFSMRLYKKVDDYCTVYLQKEKSEVLKKFLDYIDANTPQILQCDYEHGCSLFVTDVDFI